jgi:hypothetical protein
MKKTLELIISTKEALELLGNPSTPKSLSKKIVKAIQAGTAHPKGALAAASANAQKKTMATKAAKKSDAAVGGKSTSPSNGKEAKEGVTHQ